MLKNHDGMTLIEVMVTLLLTSILIGTIFTLLTNSSRLTKNIESDIKVDLFVNNFIETFSTEIASASNLEDFPSIWINNNPLPSPNELINQTNFSIQIFSIIPSVTSISGNLIDEGYSSFIEYTIQPFLSDDNLRKINFPNELVIYKTKKIFTGSTPSTGSKNESPIISGGIDLFNQKQVVLKKIKNFFCIPSTNVYIGGLDCTITMFETTGIKGNLNNTAEKIYRFYADAKNQP